MQLRQKAEAKMKNSPYFTLIKYSVSTNPDTWYQNFVHNVYHNLPHTMILYSKVLVAKLLSLLGTSTEYIAKVGIQFA